MNCYSSMMSRMLCCFLLVFGLWMPMDQVGGTSPSCKTNTRRLVEDHHYEVSSMMDGTHYNGTYQTFRSYGNQCGSETYELHLTMGIHFALYARPVNYLAHRVCPPLILHANSSADEGKVKEALLGDDEDMSSFFQYGSLDLGTFQFQDIAQAYQAIDVDESNERAYDIVSNNCAVLILGMMRVLRIHLSPDERQSVVAALVSADRDVGGRLAGYIRESGLIESTLRMPLTATDEQLLERLALRQIALVLDGTESGVDEQDSSHRERNVVQQRASSSLTREGHRSLIVGGTPAGVDEFTFFVQAEDFHRRRAYGFMPLCGAVLVAPDVILTTANCYDQFKYSVKVLVGSSMRNREAGSGQWRNITSDILIHPKYKVSTNGDDSTYNFAMMKIEAVTSTNVKPVKLNTDSTNPVVGQSLTALGYGKTDPKNDASYPKRLQKVSVKAYSNERCTRYYNQVKPKIAFCAHTKEKGPCVGDYGGPLLDSEKTLVGVFSGGTVCASSDGTPRIYSRVSGGIDWIQDTICKLSDYNQQYDFCPEFICPPDLRLLGEDGASSLGGAALPLVKGSSLKSRRPIDAITQLPAAGLQLSAGDSTVVKVTAQSKSPKSKEVSCNWRVSVAPIEPVAYVPARPLASSKFNKTVNTPYSLNVPFMGRFYSVQLETYDFGSLRTENSSLTLYFKKISLSSDGAYNLSSGTFLQSFVATGTNDTYEFPVTVDVTVPDHSTDLYFAFFSSTGIARTTNALYTLIGQVKKM